MASESDANSIGGTPRARSRPAGILAPSDWVMTSPPAPKAADVIKAEDQPGGRDPVRYGDWESKGLAIDF